MRKLVLVAGLAAAALLPSFAYAQQSCDQRARTAADITSLLGDSARASHGGCAQAYGYYDQKGLWHVNNVNRADARGYFDRDGAWVDGAPNGYYDSVGHWTAGRQDASANGYFDARGGWIPASVDGYYDEGGQWVASVSGHYDDNGRWVASQVAGAYDAGGRWMPGARSGHAGADGVWVADSQPGYYDGDHHWRAGPARGYYDTRGVWIAIAPSAVTMGADASFAGAAEGRDVDTREEWLEQHIHAAEHSGALTRDDTASDLDKLSAIRREESGMREREGQLSPQDEARLQGRLDRLSAALRQSLGGPDQ